MNMDQPNDAMKKMTRALKRRRSLEIIDAVPPPPAILDAPPGEEQEQMEEGDPEPEDINDEPGDDEESDHKESSEEEPGREITLQYAVDRELGHVWCYFTLFSR